MLLDEERGVYLALMFSSIEKDRSGAMEGHQWMYACMHAWWCIIMLCVYSLYFIGKR